MENIDNIIYICFLNHSLYLIIIILRKFLFMIKKPTDDKIVKLYEAGIQALDEGNYRDALSDFIKCEIL